LIGLVGLLLLDNVVLSVSFFASPCFVILNKSIIRFTLFRMASKANNNIDEPGAFPAREWLRQLVVGKMVAFETRKQGATAGDRVYGLLTYAPPGTDPSQALNLAVEAVRNGHATPKSTPGGGGANGADDNGEGGEDDAYKSDLQKAFEQARLGKLGIHSAKPLVRKITNAGDDFQMSQLVQKSQKTGSQGKIKCVIEYVFDGSRCRVQVTDPSMGDMLYGSFTLLMAGISSPRVGNPRTDPPTPSEEFADQARAFSEQRILQRELDVVLFGTDKPGVCAVGSIQHPKGSIAVELLKSGLAKISDWSVRMMSAADVPALRIAETTAKRSKIGVWHSYTPPALSGASEIAGIAIEVLTGDTLNVLPDGQVYDSEDKLIKVSLASIRAPRVGSERVGRADEPYWYECKERLRALTVGKPIKIQVHYERDIPLGDSNTEKRKYGTVSTKGKADIGEVLIAEGLATTQFHKDGEETSPRYDEMRAAEAIAKASKKGQHSGKEYKAPVIIDLTDPKKAKANTGSLIRAGKLKAVVEYCFNGSRFKMMVPSENCHIMFAPNAVRSPQPSPPSGKGAQGKTAEPFGDAARRHARMTVHQRTVEIDCTGLTNGGVVTGSLFVGTGAQKMDYAVGLVASGLATVDQRKIDYGEAPKALLDAQTAAQNNKVGIWSLESAFENSSSKGVEVSKGETKTIRISEIRSGTHFFYNVTDNEAVKVVEDSMKLFTTNNGTGGAPCDVKKNKVVAALFDDGNGKSWYRAKILDKVDGGTKAEVLFIDHGNVANVPVATHLRPLDASLDTDKIPPVATEAALALTLSRPISDEYGFDAARMFQSLCWDKDLTAHIYGKDEAGRVNVVIATDSDESVNEKLVSSGLARVAKPYDVRTLARATTDGSSVTKLAADLNVAQETARKSRAGMWRYGDIGDDDDDQM
jgi:staphylococcal nuclease domain-containing protein 1